MKKVSLLLSIAIIATMLSSCHVFKIVEVLNDMSNSSEHNPSTSVSAAVNIGHTLCKNIYIKSTI